VVALSFRTQMVSCLSAHALAVCVAASQVAAAQTPPAPSAPPARFMVVLDAAHGGDDLGGKFRDGLPEKAFTLALSVRLRSLLGARGIQVITTRESDAAVSLNRRSEIANHANAQACLSLHASETGSGIHLFVSSLAPVQLTRFAPWKTTQAAFVTRSLALAGVLNSGLLQAGMGVTLGRTSLLAVDSMSCPAVAVEIAPESAPASAPGLPPTAELNDPAYQARVAEALAAALLQWRTDAGRSEARNP
jgi:N-acetylmuramoyl-L-alanine amidase